MIGTVNSKHLKSSFRDPSGFLATQDGVIYRQGNNTYQEHYDHLLSSGLYQNLVDSGLLIPHSEVDIKYAITKDAYKIIKPELVEFISYPYEWCFSQLKDAALTTLEIEKRALNYGMSLKDCSAYNIQFVKGNPVLIDTLSFAKYNRGQPWIAYRQFCQHFLAPLALMCYSDIRLNQLFRVYMDGVPLDLASLLLPLRTRFDFFLLSHIHLHARSQKHFADRNLNISNYRIGQLSLLGLIDSLESGMKRLKWKVQRTEWAKYYQDTNYTPEAFEHKKRTVAKFLDKVNPSIVWDFGANTGVFSLIAGEKGIKTISFDIDPVAIEKSYLENVAKGGANILPLLLDLTNPSPSIGWQNKERMSLIERGPADTVLALALIHHLAISNNVPFGMIADFLQAICNTLIIEFIPKHDSQVQRLLSTREDIFPDYTQQSFEQELGKYFTIKNSVKIRGSERILYLMQRRHSA